MLFFFLSSVNYSCLSLQITMTSSPWRYTNLQWRGPRRNRKRKKWPYPRWTMCDSSKVDLLLLIIHRVVTYHLFSSQCFSSAFTRLSQKYISLKLPYLPELFNDFFSNHHSRVWVFSDHIHTVTHIHTWKLPSTTTLWATPVDEGSFLLLT